MRKSWLVKSATFRAVLGSLACDNRDIHNIVQLCFCHFMSNNLKGIRFVPASTCYAIAVKDPAGDPASKRKDFFQPERS